MPRKQLRVGDKITIKNYVTLSGLQPERIKATEGEIFGINKEVLKDNLCRKTFEVVGFKGIDPVIQGGYAIHPIMAEKRSQ